LLAPFTVIVRFRTSSLSDAKGGELEAVVDELAVDLVADDEVLLDDDLADRPELLAVVGGAGRVARAVEEEELRLLRDGGAEHLGGQAEAVLLAGLDDHGMPPAIFTISG
jgi:hypothetical protein